MRARACPRHSVHIDRPLHRAGIPPDPGPKRKAGASGPDHRERRIVMPLSNVDVVSKSGSPCVGAIRNVTTSAARLPDPAESDSVADFESVRSRLFGIAHRMLGRAADAE